MGRSVKKDVYTYSAGAWNLTSTKLFVYNGWNLIQELDGSGTTEKSYVWGLDLSQTLHGAGGVGGLVASTDGTDTFYYDYDANGNVGQMINVADGSVQAHYEYDPFGNEIYSYGALKDDNQFRFSTKYFLDEIDLYYYGYRYYLPELGRWINRDPIGEIGGINLYLFAWNNSQTYIDLWGLCDLQGVIESSLVDVAKNVGLKIVGKKAAKGAVGGVTSALADSPVSPVGDVIGVGYFAVQLVSGVAGGARTYRNFSKLKTILKNTVSDLQKEIAEVGLVEECCFVIEDGLYSVIENFTKSIGSKKKFKNATKKLPCQTGVCFDAYKECVCATRKVMKDWLKNNPKLLQEAYDAHNDDPSYFGQNPDTAIAWPRDSAISEQLRTIPGNRPGHHPDGLGLGGSPRQQLTHTGDIGGKGGKTNPKHSKISGLQKRIRNEMFKELKKCGRK